MDAFPSYNEYGTHEEVLFNNFLSMALDNFVFRDVGFWQAKIYTKTNRWTKILILLFKSYNNMKAIEVYTLKWTFNVFNTCTKFFIQLQDG